MRVHYLQHVEFEGLSMIGEWADERGFRITSTPFYSNCYELPDMDDFDLLIVLGGSMSANDNAVYSWLEPERAFIREAIDADKYVLGICLGAQQIAKVLGAHVQTNPQKEIGWFPIAFLDHVAGHPLLRGLNNAMTVLHWHGESFEIPDLALRLARSVGCANQGFLYKEKVLALQFHLEMDGEAVEHLIEACRHELGEGQFIQSELAIRAGAERYYLKNTLYQLLDNWVP